MNKLKKKMKNLLYRGLSNILHRGLFYLLPIFLIFVLVSIANVASRYLMDFRKRPLPSKVEDLDEEGIILEERWIKHPFLKNHKIYTHIYIPKNTPPTGIVVGLHGYGDNNQAFYLLKARKMCSEGFIWAALDYPGLGQSDGVTAYIPDFELLVDIVAKFIHMIQNRKVWENLPLFLFGNSMGGAIALKLNMDCKANVQGAILVAPMCKIHSKMFPPKLLIDLLWTIAHLFPYLPCTPSPDVCEQAFKLESAKRNSRESPTGYFWRPRFRTAATLLLVTEEIDRRMEDVKMPFLVVHGECDTVTDPQVSKELHRRADSKDKTLILYPGMWHSLLEGEPEDNVDKVLTDIFLWLKERVSKHNTPVFTDDNLDENIVNCETSTKDEQLVEL